MRVRLLSNLFVDLKYVIYLNWYSEIDGIRQTDISCWRWLFMFYICFSEGSQIRHMKVNYLWNKANLKFFFRIGFLYSTSDFEREDE